MKRNKRTQMRRFFWLCFSLFSISILTGPAGGGCLTSYEFLLCRPGETQACYAGPDGTIGRGACKGGERRCKDDGTWTDCEGQVLPKVELCNGIDDDCNGRTDDLANVPVCTLQRGVCKGATRGCEGATQTSACDISDYQKQHAAYEVNETSCDGLDNDCDGETDEGCECRDGRSRSCFSGDSGCGDSGGSYQCKGLCRSGTQRCVDGKWSSCQGEVLPADKELCNGQDDNCDGRTDEGCKCSPGDSQSCGVAAVGVCQKGKQRCGANGEWGKCTGESKPSAELCDGLDNDCDGQTDEGPDGKPLQQNCFSGPAPAEGKGVCKGGVQVCSNGMWGTCRGEVVPATETCDGKDEDCNGKIDDGASLCSAGQLCRNGQCRAAPETVVYKGSFKSASSRYSVSGDVEVRKSSGERIVFLHTFSTDPGPGLYIYLVNDPNGRVVEAPPNYIDLGKIKSTRGMQTYSLPAGVSVANYKSVVVWCKPFGVNFGFATFGAP